MYNPGSSEGAFAPSFGKKSSTKSASMYVLQLKYRFKNLGAFHSCTKFAPMLLGNFPIELEPVYLEGSV